jgi:hypothetical protein
MILLLQMASRFVGGIAFAIMFTIVLAIAIRYFAKRERNKRLIRLPKIKGVDRSRRRMEVASRRRSHN